MAIVTTVLSSSQSFRDIIKLFIWEKLGHDSNSLPLSEKSWHVKFLYMQPSKNTEKPCDFILNIWVLQPFVHVKHVVEGLNWPRLL